MQHQVREQEGTDGGTPRFLMVCVCICSKPNVHKKTFEKKTTNFLYTHTICV